MGLGRGNKYTALYSVMTRWGRLGGQRGVRGGGPFPSGKKAILHLFAIRIEKICHWWSVAMGGEKEIPE